MKLKSQLRFDVPGSRKAPAYGLIPNFDLLLAVAAFVMTGGVALPDGPLLSSGVELSAVGRFCPGSDEFLLARTATIATTTTPPNTHRMILFMTYYCSRRLCRDSLRQRTQPNPKIVSV